MSTALYRYNNSCKNSNYLFSEVNDWLQSPFSNFSSNAAFLSALGLVIQFPMTAVTNSFSIRPVLYLTSETQITGGDGSSTKPFELSL